MSARESRQAKKEAARDSEAAAAAVDPVAVRARRLALVRTLGIVVALGLLVPIAFPTPDVWPLAWVVLGGLAWQLRGARTVKRALLLGFAFAFASNLGGYYWVTGLLMQFGGFPFVAALPVYVLLAAYQGLLYGAWAAGVVWLRERAGVPLWVSGPALLVVLEKLMPFLFPWSLGESQYLNRWFAQCADLFGIFGLSALVALTNLAIEELAWRRWLAPAPERKPAPVRLLAVTAALVVAAHVYGAVRTWQVDARVAGAPRVKVGIIQPNVGIFDKHDPTTGLTRGDLLRKLSVEAEAAGAELIVWPEAAYPGYITKGIDVIPPRSRPYAELKGTLVFGAIRLGDVDPATGRRKSSNSLLLTGPDGVVQGAYDKNFLVWFSEKIPYSDLMPWINRVLPYSANFEPGTSVPVWKWRDYLIAPNVCFEDILPAWTHRLEGAPHLIVNSTEDAWFGATTEPWYHLAFATFRAIESHTSMVRSVNTGPSAVIDPAGRVVRVGGIFTREIIIADVPMLQTFTVYQKIGDLFVWLCAMALPAMAVLGRARRRRDRTAARP